MEYTGQPGVFKSSGSFWNLKICLRKQTIVPCLEENHPNREIQSTAKKVLAGLAQAERGDGHNGRELSPHGGGRR